MTTLGDLLAKEEPTLQDRDAIRREMNNLQQQVSTLSVLMDDTGNLDPNLFLQHSRGFSVLPHECASMYNENAQAIGDDSWTNITYGTTSTATWGKGMRYDPSTGYIYIEGTPRDTVLLILAWAGFAPNATGERGIAWKADDGSIRYQIYPNRGAGEFDSVRLQIVHMRQIKSAHSYYYAQAWQDSGGSLNLNYAGLIIARLR